ncbi:MAG: S9 family peptidase, partial [Deltaproteobacteria bacterium]|nr:S9 family peptidase [Deltaproteobacteria bacterium]
KFITWGPDDVMTSGPISFTKGGDSLYLIDSRNANAGRLTKTEIAGKDFQVIAEDPQYDVSEVMIHPDRYEVQAVAFTKARTEWQVLDESITDDFKALAKLDAGDYRVRNRDDADKTWLVAFEKDDGPIAYWAYDRETKKGTFLFHHRPVLNDYELAPMEPISFKSRDGLTIHGYITYPVGKGKTNLPMVLNVHGGPYYRDTWGYFPEVQWFANRGYVC